MIGLPRIGACLAVLVLCLAVSSALAKPSVTAARIGHFGDATRFVLDLSESTTFRIFTLDDPHRVVVDLPAVEWRLGATTLPIERGLVRALRFGQFQADISRVVLDLNGPVEIKQAIMLQPRHDEGYRLVIDLKPVARAGRGEPKAGAAKHSPAPTKSAVNGQAQEMARAPKPPPDRPSFAARPVIVIDPGHGGADPGAISLSKVYEKTITLRAARELKKQLEAGGRYRVVLTRDSDVYVSLRARVARARAAHARLFLSIHADNHENPRIRGASVYTLSDKASDAEAAELAQRENKSDIVAGVDLNGEYDEEVAQILISLVQQQTTNCSARFAGLLIPELGKETKLLGHSHRFAGFRVLKAPDIPSVLVELGYFSNPADERMLRTPAHRARLMARVAAAIDSYMASANC